MGRGTPLREPSEEVEEVRELRVRGIGCDDETGEMGGWGEEEEEGRGKTVSRLSRRIMASSSLSCVERVVVVVVVVVAAAAVVEGFGVFVPVAAVPTLMLLLKSTGVSRLLSMPMGEG